MKIETRVKLLFFIFSLISSLLIGTIALYYIHESIDLFVNSPNKELAAIMADRLFFKFICGFTGTSLLISVIAIVVGTLLFHRISKAFLKTVSDLTGLAEQRLGGGKSETEILKKYFELLHEDASKMRNLEKVTAWKDGARLLIHEVKNPLTPLKLSLQDLSMTSCSDDDTEEINSALTSVQDIENVLSTFKELVNIEYDTPQNLDFLQLISKLEFQLLKMYPTLKIVKSIKSKNITISSVENLLKMVILNLIKNGIEENDSGVEFHIIESESQLKLSTITRQATINEPETIFDFGVSNKGSNRGYGLYLCNMISNYLSLDLFVNNNNNNVYFTFSIKKVCDE